MRWPVVIIGIVLISLFSGIRIIDPEPVESVRLNYFDNLQQTYPREWQDLPVRVVDIDEATLAQLGQWPWPRTMLAELTEKLGRYGAAAVSYDALFAEPDRLSPNRLLDQSRLSDLLSDSTDSTELLNFDNDEVFAEALMRTPSILGVAAGEEGGGTGATYDKAGFVQIGVDPIGSVSRVRKTTPLVPNLAEATAGIGSINLSPLNASDVVRRVPLVWRSEDGLIPTLSVETLRVAMGETTYLVRGLADVERAMASLQVGGYDIPTTSVGEFLVHFRADDPRLYVSAADVLAEGFEEELIAKLQGNLVLVGTSAAGLLDIRTTALRERVPGVSVHAQVLEQILTDSYLKRSDVTSVIEIVSFASLGLILATVMSLFGPLSSMLTGGVGAAVVLGVSHSFFARQGVLFDASFPILAGILTYGILTAYQFYIADREKRMIRQSFSQYLAPSVLAEIERKGYQIELGGEVRPVTVMFTDIRNFTPLGERLGPPALVSLLNDLFSTLTDEILNRGGTIDKYIGDNVMAFWNAPLAIEGHEGAAARAALDMRAALIKFCASRNDLGQTIELATGLAVGEVLVGNIGSKQRFNYSVLGDTVNVAARAEAACRPIGFDIVATSETQAAAPELAWIYAGSLRLKGKSDVVGLFILVGDENTAKSEEFIQLSAAHHALVAAIEAGSDTKEQLASCTTLSKSLDVDMTDFYSKVPARYADFRTNS